MLKVLLALGVVIFFGGCLPVGTCDLIVEVQPVITVTDGATHLAICDATIIATSASADASTLTLVTFIPPADGGAPNCKYFPASIAPDGGISGGASFPDGTYTLQVSRPGYGGVTVPNVVAQSFSCNQKVQPAQQVNIVLTPS